MHALRLSVAATVLVLAGCNAAAPTQPVPESASANTPAVNNSDAPAAESSRDRQAASTSTPSNPSAPTPQPPANPIQTGFDQLSGRLTLLQEQVLQLRTNSQQLMEQNQMLLNRMQVMTRPADTADATEGGQGMASGSASDQLDAAIGQLMQLMNQLDAPAGGGGDGQFAMTTTYTLQGGWILLRYDRHSGAAWLAEGGRWQLLQDVPYLEPSIYRILVHRADQDSKGYVAVRIDEQTGMSWWLNGDRWQEYEL
ncbi:hypothetical protein CLV44_11332 [Marinobacterium halophilum]|uniref:Uncharacterized protein n=1 Tax=Marinobacterium halophilum TaxID=267374 RepID=A0A2P8EUQ6_9GAMM|nr:hypothetical protein [Marinobacterium halophilum]PSL13203.1 hypothetical protein CLV44_11332 [Marinobacterium halophilum]